MRNRKTSINQISALRATLGRYNPTTASEAAILPTLGPERKGNTPVHNPDSAHGTVTGRHLDNLLTALNTQTRRVGDAMTDIIRQVENETILAEVETLAVIAGESSKKGHSFSSGGATHITVSLDIFSFFLFFRRPLFSFFRPTFYHPPISFFLFSITIILCR